MIFEKPDKFRTRIGIMLLGVILQAFGLVLLMKVNMGVDPYATFLTGITKHIPYSYGTIYLSVQILMLVVVLYYDITQIGFGTLGNVFLLGYVVDFFTWICNRLVSTNIWTIPILRYAIFMVGLVVLLLGASLYIASGLGVGPYDAIPLILEKKIPKVTFRVIRILWDILFLTMGALLGSKIGFVTFGIALFAGIVIAWMRMKVEKILA